MLDYRPIPEQCSECGAMLVSDPSTAERHCPECGTDKGYPIKPEK